MTLGRQASESGSAASAMSGIAGRGGQREQDRVTCGNADAADLQRLRREAESGGGDRSVVAEHFPDGLRAEAARPLPEPSLSGAQLIDALGELGSR